MEAAEGENRYNGSYSSLPSVSTINYTTDFDYNSYENHVSGICSKTEVMRFSMVVTPVFFIVVIMLSCVGNVLVLWVLMKYENLKSLTNTFLLNLAISDLIFTFGLPFWAMDLLLGWIFGLSVCKSVSFIFYLGYYSSLLFLMVLTVHRYMAVVHPLSMLWNTTRYHSMGISVTIWILSSCAAIPHLLFISSTTVDGRGYCDFIDTNKWKRFCIYQQNIFFLISFFIIAFCYIRILGRLLRPTSHTRPKTVKLILCIVIAFYLGWTPYNLSIFFDSLISFQISPFNECPVSTAIDYVLNLSRVLAFSHCCLNPMFYVFMGVKFREHLKKMLMNVCRKGEPPQRRRHSHLIYSSGEEVSFY